MGKHIDETYETERWTNREILLKTYYLQVELNGKVGRHDRDLYGDPSHADIGIKQRVAAIEKLADSLRAGVKVLAWIVGIAVTAIGSVVGALAAFTDLL